jgi:hypothetical protein
LHDATVPKDWAKGLTKETDPRIARNAEAHRGLQYIHRTPVDNRRFRNEPMAWSSGLAYALGLVATDGCLINTGRHVAFVSNDRDLVETFLKCVGRPDAAIRQQGNAHRVQFGDVVLYRWLEDAGLTQRKSLTLGRLIFPNDRLFDVVRGLLDGDGSISHYVHRPVLRDYPRYLYRRLSVLFHSASFDHLDWLQATLRSALAIRGAILTQRKSSPNKLYALKYGRYASIALLTKLYEDPTSPRLMRKWMIWEDFKVQPVTTRPYRRRSSGA